MPPDSPVSNSAAALEVDWRKAPARPELSPAGIVHIWRAKLSPPDATLATLTGFLNAEETRRAEKYHFERHRRRFIAARGMLREILGRYLNTPPPEIEFAYAEHGKPRLGGSAASSRLQFNVSHAQDVAVFAITAERDLGIDVEHAKRLDDGERIASRFFSSREVEQFLATPAEERRAAFFRCWTRKEAFIKAIGEGLSHPLNRFDVEFAADAPAALVATRPDPAVAEQWSMTAFTAWPDFPAAVVIEGSDSPCRFFDWKPA